MSTHGSSDPRKLKDRAAAHTLIFSHARRAGIGFEIPEMQHFARKLFLLARQCGAVGLGEESKRLFSLAQTASGPKKADGLDFRLYRMVAGLLGWSRVGRLSCYLDQFRFGT